MTALTGILDPDGSSFWDQLAGHLRAAIRAGEFTHGQRLPSENRLAVMYGLSVGTVRKAMRAVQDDGLAVAKHGSGVYVRGDGAGGGDMPDLDDVGRVAAVAALRRYQSELAAEMDRANRALAALARGVTPRPDAAKSGTYRLLREYAASLPPGSVFTIGDALAYLETRGWRTAAADRRATCATALSRMVQYGEIEKHVNRGRYLTPGAPAAP